MHVNRGRQNATSNPECNLVVTAGTAAGDSKQRHVGTCTVDLNQTPAVVRQTGFTFYK